MRDVVRPGRVPVGRRHFDRRVRHRGAYEAVHRFRIRLLLVQLSDRRARVWCEKLDDSTVEAFLLLSCGGESWNRFVHVRQASVGDHDHLPVHRRLPGSDVGERQPADAAPGSAHTIYRRHGLDGRDEFDRRFDRFREKLKKDNEITEDEQKDGEKKLQDITDDFVKQADSITKKKEEEILSI